MTFVETFSSFTLQDPGSANQTHVSWGTHQWRLSMTLAS